MRGRVRQSRFCEARKGSVRLGTARPGWVWIVSAVMEGKCWACRAEQGHGEAVEEMLGKVWFVRLRFGVAVVERLGIAGPVLDRLGRRWIVKSVSEWIGNVSHGLAGGVWLGSNGTERLV